MFGVNRDYIVCVDVVRLQVLSEMVYIKLLGRFGQRVVFAFGRGTRFK